MEAKVIQMLRLKEGIDFFDKIFTCTKLHHYNLLEQHRE